jgi:hypothetical protein
MPSSIVVVKRAQTVASASKDKSEKEARFYNGTVDKAMERGKGNN